MGATGESVKRLTDVGYFPAWSPDGKRIVCSTSTYFETPQYLPATTSQIYIVNVSTGEKELVTSEVRDALQPSWSPHGYRIAFWGFNAGQRNIWTIPAHSGKAIPVLNETALSWNPTWSPDGKYLYFSSDRGGSMNLWRIALDERSGKVLGSPEPVTAPAPYNGLIAFSRDGRRVVYVAQFATANIQKVEFDPVRETIVGQPSALTQGFREAVHPDLSRDGQSLAYASRGNREDIYVMRRDGTAVRQLTDSYRNRGPRWSPDGTRLCFMSNRGGTWEIWTIRDDGSDLRQRSQTAAGQRVIYPIWSPDGAHIAASMPDASPVLLHAADAVKLSEPEGLPPMQEANLWLWPHSWSRDGSKIVGDIQHSDGTLSGVAVYSLSSKQYLRIADFGSSPRWLRDSRRIIFRHQDKLYLADAASKKIHPILSVAPHEIEWAFAVSEDDRLICFSLLAVEADIWLMTLER
jgi:eukaryotic-like serine/threonine-protein kinase